MLTVLHEGIIENSLRFISLPAIDQAIRESGLKVYRSWNMPKTFPQSFDCIGFPAGTSENPL
ncbi:MAG: hypothetical protein LC749_03390 [Actinobacteria bacterium]|nr:hypothetical protein [Actinomycetota bacterium]